MDRRPQLRGQRSLLAFVKKPSAECSSLGVEETERHGICVQNQETVSSIGQLANDNDFAPLPKRQKNKQSGVHGLTAEPEPNAAEFPNKADTMRKNGTLVGVRSSKRLQKKHDPQQTLIINKVTENVIEDKPSDPDLRLEARIASEQYALLTAGKPVHPFFRRQKPSEQSNISAAASDDLLSPALPFHVIQNAENVEREVDWSACRWSFPEASDEAYQNEELNVLTCGHRRSAITMLSENYLSVVRPLPETFLGIMNFLKTTSASALGEDTLLGNLEESYAWYKQRAENSPLGVLWTDAYQPQSSEEVCGNRDSVSKLNNWLSSWKARVLLERKLEGETQRQKPLATDGDSGWFQDDSDHEAVLSDDDDELENTIVLTGPVGCGKSAAVYACANEQGFQVIEINASDIRTGAAIKQKVGEASESHALNWPFLDAKSKTNGDVNCSLALSDGQKGKMTMILFEEVDTIFDEDKGFLSVLIQFAKTAKRPIILTSNRRQPLPRFRYNEISFLVSSVEDMVVHACMVCISRGLSGDPWFMRRIIQSYQQDLRKVMMVLQFWGQGIATHFDSRESSHQEGCLLKDSIMVFSATKSATEVCSDSLCATEQAVFPTTRNADVQGAQTTWWFGSDAQYLWLPRLLSVSFPCALSKTIAERISKAIIEVDRAGELASAQSADAAALLQAEVSRAKKRLVRKRSTEFRCTQTTSDVAGPETNDDSMEMEGSMETNLEADDQPYEPSQPQLQSRKFKRLQRLSEKHKEMESIVDPISEFEFPPIQEEGFSSGDMEKCTSQMDPGRSLWVELKMSEEPLCHCDHGCDHANAFKICHALAEVAETFSSCDMISSCTMEDEIPAELADRSLQHVMEVCNEVMTRKDEDTSRSHSIPWQEHNLYQLQKQNYLKEMLFLENHKMARLGLSATSFNDYVTYMGRIVKVEELQKAASIRPRHRKSRGYQEDYLLERGVSEGGVEALRQFFNFKDRATC